MVDVVGAPGPAEEHAEGHQALLDAVVQVAFDATAFVVDGFDHFRAAHGQGGYPAPQQLLRARAQEALRQFAIQRRDTGQALHAKENEQHPEQSDADRVVPGHRLFATTGGLTRGDLDAEDHPGHRAVADEQQDPAAEQADDATHGQVSERAIAGVVGAVLAGQPVR
jgi:hypothetical protein